MKKQVSLLAIISILVFIACSSGKTMTSNTKSANKEASILGIEWALESVRSTDSDDLITPNAKQPTLTFSTDGKKVSGNSGCNRFSGNVTINGNNISFGNLVSTRMYCVGAMKIENAMTKVFRETTNYETSSNKLFLKKDNIVIATFTQSK